MARWQVALTFAIAALAAVFLVHEGQAHRPPLPAPLISIRALPKPGPLPPTSCDEPAETVFANGRSAKVFELKNDARRMTATGEKTFSQDDIVSCFKSNGFWQRQFEGEWDPLYPDSVWLSGHDMAYLIEYDCPADCSPPPYAFETENLDTGKIVSLENQADDSGDKFIVSAVYFQHGILVYSVRRNTDQYSDLGDNPKGREIVRYDFASNSRIVLEHSATLNDTSLTVRHGVATWRDRGVQHSAVVWNSG